jgi:hypothetical protein
MSDDIRIAPTITALAALISKTQSNPESGTNRKDNRQKKAKAKVATELQSDLERELADMPESERHALDVLI